MYPISIRPQQRFFSSAPRFGNKSEVPTSTNATANISQQEVFGPYLWELIIANPSEALSKLLQPLRRGKAPDVKALNAFLNNLIPQNAPKATKSQILAITMQALDDEDIPGLKQQALEKFYKVPGYIDEPTRQFIQTADFSEEQRQQARIWGEVFTTLQQQPTPVQRLQQKIKEQVKAFHDKNILHGHAKSWFELLQKQLKALPPEVQTQNEFQESSKQLAKALEETQEFASEAPKAQRRAMQAWEREFKDLTTPVQSLEAKSVEMLNAFEHKDLSLSDAKAWFGLLKLQTEALLRNLRDHSSLSQLTKKLAEIQETERSQAKALLQIKPMLKPTPPIERYTGVGLSVEEKTLVGPNGTLAQWKAYMEGEAGLMKKNFRHALQLIDSKYNWLDEQSKRDRVYMAPEIIKWAPVLAQQVYTIQKNSPLLKKLENWYRNAEGPENFWQLVKPPKPEPASDLDEVFPDNSSRYEAFLKELRSIQKSQETTPEQLMQQIDELKERLSKEIELSVAPSESIQGSVQRLVTQWLSLPDVEGTYLTHPAYEKTKCFLELCTLPEAWGSHLRVNELSQPQQEKLLHHRELLLGLMHKTLTEKSQLSEEKTDYLHQILTHVCDIQRLQKRLPFVSPYEDQDFEKALVSVQHYNTYLQQKNNSFPDFLPGLSLIPYHQQLEALHPAAEFKPSETALAKRVDKVERSDFEHFEMLAYLILNKALLSPGTWDNPAQDVVRLFEFPSRIANRENAETAYTILRQTIENLPLDGEEGQIPEKRQKFFDLLDYVQRVTFFCNGWPVYHPGHGLNVFNQYFDEPDAYTQPEQIKATVDKLMKWVELWQKESKQRSPVPGDLTTTFEKHLEKLKILQEPSSEYNKLRFVFAEKG